MYGCTEGPLEAPVATREAHDMVPEPLILATGPYAPCRVCLCAPSSYDIRCTRLCIRRCLCAGYRRRPGRVGGPLISGPGSWIRAPLGQMDTAGGHPTRQRADAPEKAPARAAAAIGPGCQVDALAPKQQASIYYPIPLAVNKRCNPPSPRPPVRRSAPPLSEPRLSGPAARASVDHSSHRSAGCRQSSDNFSTTTYPVPVGC